MSSLSPRTWTSDNGNGTFSNPLFYDEFSDPDLIRVGDDFYLTGTTMHAMPGLPVLHSRDLVNWTLLAYAFDRLDLGLAFRLEGGQEIYGQGIWAPCFRYHNGLFHIFSNVNGQTTQHFSAGDPAGPWTRSAMQASFHDLSVLFDDDGRVFVVWGYDELNFAQLTPDLTAIVPGTQRVIIPRGSGMGEGCHFYKIDGVYYITSAWYAGRMRMPCARAARPEGPYEVNLEISADEDFGLAAGPRVSSSPDQPFAITPGSPHLLGRMSMHQGGIVDTPGGEWWGFSMMDYNSVGRLTCLSPVTWQDGWPYFGLRGNLGRTPRIWTKPNTGARAAPTAPYQRSDDFRDPRLNPIWQWNHVPDDSRWSLSERSGWLRLHSPPASDFWWARNTLTQRAIGPRSSATVKLDLRGMQPGDVAGLALLNYPYAWLGVRREATGLLLELVDQSAGCVASAPLSADFVWLKARCDFLTEQAEFAYSTDGKTFQSFGSSFGMVYQLKTFQGIRYALFHYNTGSAAGGYADFTDFTVEEPHPRGLMRPIPFGQSVTLASIADGSHLAVRDGQLYALSAGNAPSEGTLTRFHVIDRGLGRVALQAGGAYLSVAASDRVTLRAGDPGEAETFQWIETVYGDLILLSLATQRYLRIAPGSLAITADQPGSHPDRMDGVCLKWF